VRAEQRAYVLIVGSRALSEAVGLAAAAAALHAITVGREPIALGVASLALFGVTLVLVAVLRERGTVRQSTALTLIVIAGWSAWGVAQASRAPDFLAVLTRLIGFGILGEVYLWRTLGIARGLQRWREVRNDALFALAAVIVASLIAGPVDRDALPALGLAVACSAAVALSLARSAEELSLAVGQIQGRPAGSSATGTAFALGVLAIGMALALPSLQAFSASVVRVLGPLLGDLLFTLLLPLGYLAAWLVFLVQWLRERIQPKALEIRPPTSPFDPNADAERLRDLEAARPYVFGALELVVALVAVAVAVLLIARLVQERRALFPEGATIDREGVDGIGFRATLRGLFPHRAAGRRAPADDGTPAAALRRLYWGLLELAEREGPGWRGPAETPAEHETRLAQAAVRWREAAPLVRAFEALRYGERDPNGATVDLARDALRRVRVRPGE
jgi:hypothetical protein